MKISQNNEQMLDVKLPFLLSGKHRAFPITDDSMPPLHKGNLIVCKFIESYSEITEGATYVLMTPQNIAYKRMKKHPTKKDTILLESDNKIYLPSEVKVKDIVEVWEFVCSLNIDAYKPEELNIESIMKMLRELKVEIQPVL
jgi:Peptidase S24-like